MQLLLLCLSAGFIISTNGKSIKGIFEVDNPFPKADGDNYVTFRDMKGSIGEKTLANFENAEYIDFRKGKLGHIDWKAFTKLPKLHTITMFRTQGPMEITNEHVKAMPSIKTVNLYRYRVNPEDNKDIAENAFSNTNLEELYLSFVEMKELKKNRFAGMKHLHSLELVDCNIENIDMDAFEDLQNLNKLELSYTKLTLEPGNFKSLKNLQELKLQSNDLKDINWEILDGLSNLHSLTMSDNLITASDVEKISSASKHLEKLHTLDLSKNDLSDMDWQFLKSLPNLKQLILKESHLENIDHIDKVGEHKLEALDIDNNIIAEINWDFLKNFPNLKSLKVSGNKLKNIDADKIITHLKHLNEFMFWGNDLTCETRKEVEKKLKTALPEIETYTENC